MSAKRGLGRGLDALFADVSPARAPRETELALDELTPNRYQPRAEFDRDGLAELAASIRAQGLIQPIVVAPLPDGGYMIVAGERRWRAAREAGLERVPVVVREMGSKKELLEAALVENIQRSDLNPLEEAEAFDQLHRECGMSHQDIAERVGKSRSAVSNRLRLLGLPDEVQKMIRNHELSEGQARPLLGMPSETERVDWARKAVREGLTARQVEEAATRRGSPKKTRSKTRVDADTSAAAERLTKKLQTKVEIKRRGKGGALVVAFHSEDELIRLYELLMTSRSRP